MKILVIEDDVSVIDTISLSFQVGWPEVILLSATQGSEGLSMVESESPDVIVLDLKLPDMNGFEVLRKIRDISDTPVIILSGMNEETDVIRGLEFGADDYITKPFRKMELLARIKSAMRRLQKSTEQTTLVCGPVKYFPITRQVFVDNRDVRLTVTEADILSVLLKNKGLVVTHSELSLAIWGEDYPNSADTLKVHIRHLREKLENNPSHPEMILTRPGVGYSLSVSGMVTGQ